MQSTQIAVVQRLVEWFAQQDAGTRAITMNLIRDVIAADVAKLLLKRLGERR